MRICDLSEDKIVIGMRVRSLKTANKLGTIVKIDYDDDRYTWVQWDGESFITSGFYGNECKCEIVEL